jgi:hypothetical protein
MFSKAVAVVKRFVAAAAAFVESDRPVRDAALAAVAAGVGAVLDGPVGRAAFIAAAYGVFRAVLGALAKFVSGKLAA